MIGNEIIFSEYDKEYNQIQVEGLVVDAFTEISGKVKGENFMGFGDVSGRTESKRKYKVEYYHSWDTTKQHKYYKDIFDWQLIRVTKLAGTITVDLTEKFRKA